MRDLVLGVDVGTTAVKVALFGADGKLVATHRTAYPIHRPRPGWAEQDPLDWWNGCLAGIRHVLSGQSMVAVRSVGVVSQVNTHVFVDAELTPLAPAIIWQDQRCADVARELDARFTAADKARIWGGPVVLDASFAGARAEWFARTSPPLWDSNRWEPRSRGEREEPIPACRSCQRPVCRRHRIVWASARVVEPEGTNQVTGDTVIGVADRPGRAVPSGAGAKSCVQTQRPPWQPVRAAAANLEVCPEHGDRQQARSFRYGFMTPHLMGERAPLWDSDVRASFLGLTSATTTADLSYAVLEGVAMSGRQVLDVVDVACGAPVPSLTFTGGGARSDLWARIHADVLRRPIERPRVHDSAVLGAALLGAASAGLYPSVEAAAEATVTADEVFEPTGDVERRYEAYRVSYAALREVHALLKGAERP